MTPPSLPHSSDALPPKTAPELENELKNAHAYIGQLWLAIIKRADPETMHAITDELRTVRARQAAEAVRS